ncbi:MAG: fructosamine kinase family protein [Vulcanococcus sp.]|jgi:fructosamine-3-kinase
MATQELAQWIKQQTGAELARLSPVGGGCIHSAWRLELQDGRVCFAKTNQADLLPVLEAEADGLRALRQTLDAPRPLQIPEPLALGLAGREAVLLLSWLELQSSPQRGSQHDSAWGELGAGLAQLHRSSLRGGDERFGWGQDNFLGSALQPNRWNGSWADFFCQERLGHQLRWAARSGRSLPQGEALLKEAAGWLADHKPEPCLVHGDLWSGNAGQLRDGGGAIFDPAVYRGDREVDLAMAQLFGGFPASFFAGYQRCWPLPPGHQQRVELYNLYHLLNHANLFGGSYWQQSAACIQSLLCSWS